MISSIEELGSKILGLAIKAHRELGPGLLESTYEKCLCYELEKNNIRFINQVYLDIVYDNNLKIEKAYRIDILVEDLIILELKSVESFTKTHEAQLLTYLKLSNKHLGYLLNFNTKYLKDGIKRIIL